EMSFLDHLEELRWLLIRSAIAVFLMGIVAFVNIHYIFDHFLLVFKNQNFITYRFLCNMSHKFGTEGLCIEHIDFKIQSLKMSEQFSAHLWLALTFGFILAFPYIIYEIWKFIKPALYKEEQKYASAFVIVTSLLFFIGVLFGYYVIAPLSVNFLGNYSVSQDVERNFKLASYIAIIKTSVLSSGIVFELPVFIYFLAKMGLVTPEFLKKYRKYAFVIVLVLAAIITPPDVLSQIIVTIPMMLLYEVGILISKIIVKKQNQALTKP
ncbi:MAG TPA: twin-arginine translocase subunit TatC, partial [Flavobacteriia bacterium]|nr:twin-arginine translocase subunit TatC [Flavobacteriia bacterium]